MWENCPEQEERDGISVKGRHLSEGVAGRVLKPKQGRGVGRGSGQESNPGWGIRAQVGRGRSVRKGGPVQHAG